MRVSSHPFTRANHSPHRLLNNDIHSLGCWRIFENRKYPIQIIICFLLLTVRRNQMKAPYIRRGRWGRSCVTQCHPKGPWPKHWFLKSRGRGYIVLPPAHNWAFILMRPVKSGKILAERFVSRVRRSKQKFCVFFLCATVGRGDIIPVSTIFILCYGLDQRPVISVKLAAVWSVAWIVINIIIFIVMVWLLQNEWKFLQCPYKDSCASLMFLCLKWWCLYKFYAFLHRINGS